MERKVEKQIEAYMLLIWVVDGIEFLVYSIYCYHARAAKE